VCVVSRMKAQAPEVYDTRYRYGNYLDSLVLCLSRGMTWLDSPWTQGRLAVCGKKTWERWRSRRVVRISGMTWLDSPLVRVQAVSLSREKFFFVAFKPVSRVCDIPEDARKRCGGGGN
jgi:hypothetical protein